MNRKKIIILATTLIISTFSFVGCGKTNEDNTLNKEKSKVENTTNKNTTEKDTSKKDTEKENTEKNSKAEDTQKENNKENSKIKDSKTENVNEGKNSEKADTDSGQESSSEREEPQLKTYDSVAIIEPLMFGANVTVTCKNPEVATYQVLTKVDGKMVALHDDKVAIGTTAKELFPAEEGQTVLINFFNANGVLLGHSETTLVASK